MTDQWHGRDVQGPGAAVTRPLPATMLPVEIEIYEPDAEPTRSRARARLRTHDKTSSRDGERPAATLDTAQYRSAARWPLLVH